MKFDPKSVKFPIRHLRQPMALNLFKIHLLGDRHVPGHAQTEDVLSALSAIGMEVTIDPRTWVGWFGSDARRARGDSLSVLDKAFVRINQTDGLPHLFKIRPDLMCFYKMIDGGLSKELLEPTASKKPRYQILQKAEDYQPISKWHLHIDAIEAMALAEPNGDLDWETLKEIAAARVMGYLHDRWNPRDGSIYANLSSDFSIEWSNADKSEREKIRNEMARFKPDLFPHFMNLPAIPDWASLNIEIDIGANQMHKLLFAMAADEKFLVADRFDAWALDLATAALAMFARAQVDQRKTFRASLLPDFLYWEAFEVIFFRDEECERAVFDAIEHAFEFSGAHFSIRSFELLVRAGALYKSALAKLGVSHVKVAELTSRCLEMHPIVYRGGTRSRVQSPRVDLH